MPFLLEKKRINTSLFNSLLNIIFHHGHKKHYFSPSIVMAIVTCSVQQARAWKPKVIFCRKYTTLNDLSALFPRIRISRTPEVSGWNAKQIRSTHFLAAVSRSPLGTASPSSASLSSSPAHRRQA